MDTSELDRYRSLWNQDTTIVRATDIDGPDRTLIVGHDANEPGRVHVYLRDGFIHRSVLHYSATFDRYVPSRTESFESVSMDRLIPTKRCYPELCDLDFALLAARLGTYAPVMAAFDADTFERIKGLYFYEAL